MKKKKERFNNGGEERREKSFKVKDVSSRNAKHNNKNKTYKKGRGRNDWRSPIEQRELLLLSHCLSLTHEVAINV